MAQYSCGQRVEVVGLGSGRVFNLRRDSRGVPIYTVMLEDAKLTGDGIVYSRECELKHLQEEVST